MLHGAVEVAGEGVLDEEGGEVEGPQHQLLEGVGKWRDTSTNKKSDQKVYQTFIRPNFWVTQRGSPMGSKQTHPMLHHLTKSIQLQCCQAENQTKKSQNLTFIGPYFYQKSDQKQTQTRYFEVKIRLVPKT